jgi:ATP synthase protein I
MVPPLSKSLRKPCAEGNGEHPDMSDPEELRALGKKLEEARRQREPRRNEAPPTPLGIASRFATEMVVAIAFGGGLGWLLDRLLGTRPIFIVVMFVLGAAAGIRNVMRAAAEINARQAGAPPSQKKNEET